MELKFVKDADAGLMELKFVKDALFSGMTSNSFKLGTVLSLGWFWMRTTGCTALYRGLSMDSIDFDSVLAVSQADTKQVSPPDYLQHSDGTTYFYAVRKCNGCGRQEQTSAAAVKLSIDKDGEVAEPGPNCVFDVTSEITGNGQVELIWYYCPIAQGEKPARFNIYYDFGTGQIDYENPAAVIDYIGRRFYSCKKTLPQTGAYLFVIRAVGLSGSENLCFRRLRIQMEQGDICAAKVLNVERI